MVRAKCAASRRLGWIFILVLAVSAFAQNGDVAVVVNGHNPISHATLSELRRIFAGEKHSWPGNVRIRIIVRAQGAYERVVLLRLLGMTESGYKQYWASQVFRGDAQAEPVALFSNGMQKARWSHSRVQSLWWPLRTSSLE
jgi:hypothetical protein